MSPQYRAVSARRAPTWEQFDAAKLPEHRFAAPGEDSRVLGRVAATKASDRCAYAGVVEHSVYVYPVHEDVGRLRCS